MAQPDGPPTGPRFVTLTEVAEILATSPSQVYALVRRGELPAIKIGGRGQWRVETTELEAYIQRSYDATRAFVAQNPFPEGSDGGQQGTRARRG